MKLNLDTAVASYVSGRSVGEWSFILSSGAINKSYMILEACQIYASLTNELIKKWRYDNGFADPVGLSGLYKL